MTWYPLAPDIPQKEGSKHKKRSRTCQVKTKLCCLRTSGFQLLSNVPMSCYLSYDSTTLCHPNYIRRYLHVFQVIYIRLLLRWLMPWVKSCRPVLVFKELQEGSCEPWKWSEVKWLESLGISSSVSESFQPRIKPVSANRQARDMLSRIARPDTFCVSNASRYDIPL